MFILDSHCDTPSQILRLRDLSLDNDLAQVDYPKLKKGNVDGAFFALYIPAQMDTDDAKSYLLRLLGGVKRTLAENPDKAALAVSMSQAVQNKSKGLFSIFLGLENGSPLGDSEESFELLQKLYDAGVRYVTLCHSRHNQICDSCACTTPKWGGLSPFGKRLVAEMNRIGMLVDVSHISDSSFYDVLACSTKPVVATHSSCRSLAGHPRNMTDDMIRELAARGGVIQINFYPVFLDSDFASRLSSSGIAERGESIEAEFIADPANIEKRQAWNAVQRELLALERPSYKLIADHIDHVVSLVGVDHVGIGSDYDGIEITPDGMEDVSMMPKLFDELRTRGYSEEDLTKIAGGNFFRVLEQAAQL
jgi:membrane dipeptidase